MQDARISDLSSHVDILGEKETLFLWSPDLSNHEAVDASLSVVFTYVLNT